MENRKAKQAAGLIICTIVVGCISSILVFINPLEKIQQQLSSFLYYERETDHPVVIVGIDNKSVSEDQGLGRQQEWPRSNYAKVIKNLLKYEPAAIGLDIFFRTPSEGISGSELRKILEEENLEKIKETYVNGAIHPEDKDLSELLKTNSNIFLINSGISLGNVSKLDLNNLTLLKPPVDPNNIFWGNKNQIGHNFFISDLNGMVRDAPLLFYANDAQVLAFSLVIAEYYLKLGTYNHEIKSTELVLIGNSGKTSIPLEDFRLLINFTDTPSIQETGEINKKIKRISFVDVYNESYDESFDPSFLKDKIVLIGTWNRSSGDNFFTPIDPHNATPGVAIHAQAIQTILDEAWLYNQSFAAQAVTIAALALISMLLIFGLRINWALPALGLLLLIYCVPYAQLMFRQWGIIVNLVYPPLTIILAAIVGYAYRYLTEFKMKNRVTSALGQFVNTQVAENVLNSSQTKVEKIGEKRDISVIFTDIKGFTTISEQLKAESVVALLNEYFEVMAEVIVRNGGLVDKYEGDAIMAFFEAKEGLPSHQLRAAQTALEMRAALPRLLEKWHNDPLLPGGEKKPEIDFRVGISSGEAIVGTIGSSEHIQYTAIGDIVNLGSRLESANKKYESHILLAEATFEAISNSFVCRYVDNIKVKGKDKPVKIYQLLGRKEDISAEQEELLVAYNHGIELYFQRKFSEAAEHFENRILKKWPNDFLAMIYAGRARKCMLIPPAPDWDFVYKMETK